MNYNLIFDTLKDLLETVDAGMYPETCDALENILESEDAVSVYDIACRLHSADETKALHPDVAAFLFDLYTTEIKNKNGAAANDLGSLYYTGRIGEQNYAKAVEYYTVAAELGDRQAQENLGYCYYYGRDVEKDYKKAFHYFALGAFDGHLISLYKIGDMYRNGYYVSKNEKEAFTIYEHCLRCLNDDAMDICGADICMRMGDCLAKGIGTGTDCTAALMFYQQAERLFYNRLKNGDFMIKGCYQHCIDEQAALRTRMQQSLPEFDWTGK